MIPIHIAIIMDGNRRWAKLHGKPAIFGHQYVADILLEKLVLHAADRGISYITFWAWSTENWQRSKQEVTGIMKIFKYVLSKSIDRLHKKGVRIVTIGDIDAFPKDIIRAIKDGIEKTKNNKRITVVLALNYGGRDELLRAINKVRVKGNLSAKLWTRGERGKLTAEIFSNHLDTCGIPDPDLIIRTGGEKRLSGFLLWQSEYAELYFTDTLMPDFTPEKLDEALKDFSDRERRFGK